MTEPKENENTNQPTSGQDIGVGTVVDRTNPPTSNTQHKQQTPAANSSVGPVPVVEFSGVTKTYSAGKANAFTAIKDVCLLYTSPSPRDQRGSRMPSSA